MTRLDLDEAPVIVTVGAALFTDAVRAQAAEAIPVQWAPPAAGAAEALAIVAADPRTPEANEDAARRLTSARPHWTDIRPAAEVLGLGPREILHAGPPLSWAGASGPMRGAIIGALLYEGLADNPADAEKLAATGGVELSPCHSRGAVGPMAGVVSASMPMNVIEDHEFGGSAYCTLNEGLGKVLRFGAYSPDVIERLHWLQTVLAPTLAQVLHTHGPIDIRSLVQQALQMGDECHNRNRAATSLLLRELTPDLIDSGLPSSVVSEAYRFISGNDHFFLNLAMPAGKVAADAARDIPGSSMVVAMARNGTDFGIQLSGTGDTWFTAPAPEVEGLYFSGFGPEDANPDLGDSTITETAGTGGMAMAAAPAIVRFVGGEAADAVWRTEEMYQITLTQHPAYQIPVLGFRGTPTGIDATLVVRTGIVPNVNTGIAGKEPGIGQVGAGLVTPPMSVFTDAVRALADRAV